MRGGRLTSSGLVWGSLSKQKFCAGVTVDNMLPREVGDFMTPLAIRDTTEGKGMFSSYRPSSTKSRTD